MPSHILPLLVLALACAVSTSSAMSLVSRLTLDPPTNEVYTSTPVNASFNLISYAALGITTGQYYSLVNVQSGKQAATSSQYSTLDGQGLMDAVLFGNTLYAGATYGSLIYTQSLSPFVNSSIGAIKLQSKSPGPGEKTVVVGASDKYIYAITNDGTFWQVDPTKPNGPFVSFALRNFFGDHTQELHCDARITNAGPRAPLYTAYVFCGQFNLEGVSMTRIFDILLTQGLIIVKNQLEVLKGTIPFYFSRTNPTVALDVAKGMFYAYSSNIPLNGTQGLPARYARISGKDQAQRLTHSQRVARLSALLTQPTSDTPFPASKVYPFKMSDLSSGTPIPLAPETFLGQCMEMNTLTNSLYVCNSMNATVYQVDLAKQALVETAQFQKSGPNLSPKEQYVSSISFSSDLKTGFFGTGGPSVGWYLRVDLTKPAASASSGVPVRSSVLYEKKEVVPK